MSLPQIIVLLSALGYLFFLARFRERVTFDQFATGGKNNGVWLTFASLAATFVGPAMTMGLVRAGYQVGLLYVPFAFLAGCNALLLSRFMAAPLRRKFTDAHSIGEVIGGPTGHDSQCVRLLIGLISFALTTAICIVMSKAGGELLKHMFGLPIHWGIVISTTVVTAYSSRGGIRATMQTDALQLCAFALLIPLLALLMITSDGFSFGDWKANSIEQTATAYSALTGPALLSLLVFWFLGSGFDPTYVARLLSSRSPEVAQRALRRNGLFIIAWMSLMYLVGSAGHTLDPELPASDQLLLDFGQGHYGNLLYGFFIVAMIGVVMSSQDSMLNGASVALANDIIAPLRDDLSKTAKLRIATWATLLIGVVSIWVALSVDSILTAIILIWSVYTPSVAPSLLASIYLKRAPAAPAIVSIISGLSTSATVVFSGWSAHIPAVLAGLIASSLGYYLCYRFVKAKTNRTLKESSTSDNA